MWETAHRMPLENTIDKILNAVGLSRSSKAAVPSVFSSGAGDPFAIWRNGGTSSISNDKALAAFTGWTYACIRAIAEDIQNIDLELYRVTSKDGDQERVYEHEFIEAIEGASTDSVGAEILYATAAHLEACGNAYWYLEGVADDLAKPKTITILNPGNVTPIIGRAGVLKKIIGYKYREATYETTLQPYEVIHFKFINPSNPLVGIGTVQAAAQWIDADNYAMEFNRQFFLNGARIGGFLESEANRTPEQLEYLKKSFENIYKGVENSHKVLALPKGTTYKEGGQTQKDLDFAHMMEMMRDRILAAFRVPRTALGITDDVNRANAEATDYVFAKRVIKPKMTLIVAYLNRYLVPRYGDDIVLGFADPVPENRAQEVAEMQAATGNAPVISVNEAREMYFGLDAVEGGDDVSKPFNFLSMGKTKPKAENRPAVKQSKRVKHVKTVHAKRAEERKAMASEIAKAAKDALESTIKIAAQAREKGIQNATDDEYEAVYKGFVQRVIQYENVIKQNLRSFNEDQKKKVIENLSRAIKRGRGNRLKGVDRAALFDADEWITLLVKLTGPVLTDLFAKEGKEAAALLGFADLDPLTPEVRAALDKSIELMSQAYNRTTLDLLEAKLEEGISEGYGIDELTRSVGDIFEFSDAVRAERVARTETFRIANTATKEAWKQTGVVSTVKWYTGADERVCPICEPLHGKIVDIDKDFFKKGDTVTGSDGTEISIDYDDVGAPPVHVDCRCYLRPEDINI